MQFYEISAKITRAGGGRNIGLGFCPIYRPKAGDRSGDSSRPQGAVFFGGSGDNER